MTSPTSAYMPGHYDGDGCTFPDPGHFAPRPDPDAARARHYTDRVLAAQPVSRGVEQPNGTHTAIPPQHVAGVLHALADLTHNTHMLRVAEERLLTRPDDILPGAESLGRYFHALADSIEQRMHYVVCNRLLDPEDNLHCEFDGRILIDDRGHGTCPWCHSLLTHKTGGTSHAS